MADHEDRERPGGGNSNATVAFNRTGDQLSADPKLGALADNGGPTRTHALLSGSPAMDAIPQGTNGCGTTFAEDQRGVDRPQDGDANGTAACDIGPFELEPPPKLSNGRLESHSRLPETKRRGRDQTTSKSTRSPEEALQASARGEA